MLCFKSNKTMYGCDATVLLNVYSYLVFVGEGWLALVPSCLPHLRVLAFTRWYFAWYTAFNSGAERLIIFNTFHLDSSILKCHKVMLLTVSDQIMIFLCQ